MCSSRDGVPETHLSGREVEFHRADDGVGLLVLVNTSVQVESVSALSLFSNVADSDESGERDTNHEETEGANVALAHLGEVKYVSSALAGAQIDGEESP